MDFIKYNSITNIERKKFIDNILMSGFHKTTWVRTLKIHGANYSLWCDGKTVKRARRSGFLDENESFYGDNSIREDNAEKAMKMFSHIKKYLGDIDTISIHGEIFGGSYPHPDVKEVKGATKVMKEVFYRPDNAFIVFDIKINGEFIDFNQAFYLSNLFGFEFVPVLEIGTFRDLIEAETMFPDPYHKGIGLPTIDDNIAEGWVLSPIQPSFFPNGDRVILKGKNTKFKERSVKRKDGKKEPKLSDEAQDILNELNTYINKNRLMNVISHTGVTDLSGKFFGIVIRSFMKDALKDFLIDFGDRFYDIEKKEQKIITKSAQKFAASVVREVMYEYDQRNYL